MSSAERHAEFLAERLRAMGVRVELARGATAAEGELTLGPTPFATLAQPLVIECARFYTLGHNKLKFFAPTVFFDIPALDVTRCESKADIESALRRAWASVVHDLADALAWLKRLRAPTQLVAGGARLRIVDEASGAIEVRSPREILLPSRGALAERSLTAPGDRRFRPLQSLETANELAISIASAVAERADRSALLRTPSPPNTSPVSGKRARYVLAVTNSPGTMVELGSHLGLRGFEVEIVREPTRALAVWKARSYELVFVDAHLGREDGFELALRLRQLAGVEQLPIVLLDERDGAANRSAARDAGAALYLAKPIVWDEVGETILDLLDHAAYRRFQRFAARLSVSTAAGAGGWDETTELVARGGICLRTRRDILPGAIERYRIHLPEPYEPVDVDGDVISRATLAGYASVLAGIRFRRFVDGGEPRWIQVIEALARQDGREEAR